LKETGQASFLVNSVIGVPSAPELVNKGASAEDLYTKGGVDIKFRGHTLTVKLGFIRGDYDAFTQTYKAKPVISVVDNLTTPPLMTPYIVNGGIKSAVFTNISVNVEFQGQTVKISDYNKPSKQVIVLYSDLLAKWAAFASGYCSDYVNLGKRYCFVPQSLNSESYQQCGFVATENTPLYYSTSVPQDYVELGRYEQSGTWSYSPITYSLALRLAFVFSPDQKWEIREMTSEEIGEAMVERSRDRGASSGSLLPTTVKTKSVE